MLYWVGKKPLDYVKGFPAQLAEAFDPQNTGRVVKIPTYEELKDNWQNLLFYGDNKDVLATLLELGFRGKIDLIYIDPPFKSGADYVRKVELRGLKNLGQIEEDEASLLQQTMYFDIWNNDTYLQFMYERLMLLKELLSKQGSIYIHLDWHVGHYVKLIMDEIFGEDNFINEVIWFFKGTTNSPRQYADKHDTILFYANKKGEHIFNADDIRVAYGNLSAYKQDEEGKWYKQWTKEKKYYPPQKYVDRKWVLLGKYRYDVIDDVPSMATAHGEEYLGGVTQKKEDLLKIFILASSKSDSIVLDCFVGFGTTPAAAQKFGRRWIACDINKGMIQTTSKRLQKINLEQIKKEETKYPIFAVYKVNNYDQQLSTVELTELVAQHIGIQRIRTDRFFDGYLGKNLVKIIDFNHPLTLLDLQLLQDELKKRPNEDRDITIVCLGKELAVDPWINEWNKKHPINKIKVIELKTDKKYGNFLIRKPTEAKVKIERKDKNKVVVEIQNFISPTIIERLNIDNTLFKVKIPDFRCMIDTVLIDNNYDGETFHIVYSDVPEKKNNLVKGKYEIEIPKSKTNVAVKIIDMLGEEILISKEV